MLRTGLLHGPLGTNCLHICVDMQKMFLPASPGGTLWMEQRLPAIEALAEAHAARTVLTRFSARPGRRRGGGDLEALLQEVGHDDPRAA